VSDRQTWLEEWCPQCHAAPGRRCGERRFRADRSTGQFLPSPRLHVGRGWIERRCPTCTALPGEACRTPSGKPAAVIHAARLRPGSSEISGPAVWAELERCGVRVVEVAFSGRNGSGGRAGPISVSRGAEASLVAIGRWALGDELAHALEAPVWDRYGTFAGQPAIRGVVRWTSGDQTVLITGTRGDARFRETVR